MLYKIYQLTYSDDIVHYVIQAKKRIFGIGPKIWIYYSGKHRDIDDWSLFKENAMRFKTQEDAKETIINFIADEMKLQKGNKKKNIIPKIIYEYEN